MRTVLRGSDAALVDHVRSWLADADGALLCWPDGEHRCWSTIRHLVAQRRHQVGDDAVDAILGRHPSVAARIPGLGDAAPRDRTDDGLGASVESHLSHNLLVQRPFVDAVATMLAELLADVDIPLVTGNLADLDRESLAVLRALYRHFPDEAPPLLAGFDPHHGGDPPDESGLIWRNPAADLHTVALGFAALPGSQVVDLDPTPAETRQRPRPSAPRLPAAEAIDDWARAVLDRDAPLDTAALDLVVEAVETCFGCFGFSAALRLGIDALDRLADSPEIATKAHRASLHGIVALAAHNRQFRSNGNEALARFLEHHATRALDAEGTPARRSALCYRLAVTLGRRRKQFDAAMAWAGRAIEDGRKAPSVLQRAHLEAWARNIRAYLFLGLGRPDDARRDCEVAFELVDAVIDSPTAALRAPDPWLREAGYTHSLLADNLAALAKFRDDDTGFTRWKRIADEITDVIPGIARFEAILWVDLYRRLLRFDLALAKATDGMASARAEADPLRELHYAIQVADLHDRCGDTDAASRTFEHAIALRERLGRPRFLRPIEGYAAMCWLRNGEIERARDALVARIDSLPADEHRGRAEILARLAWLETSTGRPNAADPHLDEAIEQAAALGDRSVLIDVAVVAGRCGQSMQRPEDASRAYRRALELGAGLDESTPSASKRLAAQIGLAELGDDPIARTLAAVEHWPAAAADVEAWWDLPRLCRLLGAVPTDRFMDESTPRARAALRSAAAQRADSRDLVEPATVGASRPSA
ncbi:MAG: hypothetical protein AAGE94_06240 [Acidobacteriota bacterium]